MPINLYNDIYNMNKRIIAAQATTEAVLAGNLDATRPAIGGHTGAVVGSATLNNIPYDAVDSTGAAAQDGIPDEGSGTKNLEPHFIVPITVYDKLGNEYKINVKFWKNFVDTSGDSPVTSWYYIVDGGANSKTAATGYANGYIKFDSNGRIITNDSGFEVKKTITLIPDASTGADEFDIELNFEQLTMYADDSSVKATRVDGYPPGTLVTFSIGGDGVITGVYDNGRQQPLGQIALATFENPAGLMKVGANQFAQTTNSGDFTAGKIPGRDGAGVLIPGTLEMSNVDLAKQFTEMIITQRGFQANSRVMVTSDEILQELANIKR